MRMRAEAFCATLALVAMMAGVAPAKAQGKKLVLAAPGIPPIFASVQLYVADKEGFLKKHGVDAEVRAFDTGTAAARAVITGDIELSVSPSALIINQISNADANVVAIYGLTNTDFLLASADPAKSSCQDVAGQPVGIDTVGGARSIALRTMLARGCPGVKIEDVQQVAVSSNVGPAMIAGRLAFGVLHLDDVATVEAKGKKVVTLLTVQKTDPNGHYLLYVVRADKLKENRDIYVRALAALIEAARFIRDPKNADRVAEIATVTGNDKAISKATLKPLIDIDYWPVEDSGLDRTRLEALIALMKKTGGIVADKQPVSYERLVDESVWRDASALTKTR
jgi:ABC-type nitrate/sulfonate/bicarbonate transport system substrate-binding protein